MAILLAVLITRSYDPQRETARHDTLWGINSAVGCLCLVVLGTVMLVLFKRMWKAHRQDPVRLACVAHCTVPASAIVPEPLCACCLHLHLLSALSASVWGYSQGSPVQAAV